MTKATTASIYKQEEFWNTLSHGLGILLGIAGSFVLISKNTAPAIWIYSLSVILLFSASTIYHYIADPRIKKKLRIADHISIYYLIAGTYTPVCILALAPSKGSLLLWLVWGFALLGTVLKIFFTGKFEVFSLLLYLFMGWLIALDFGFLTKTLSNQQLLWLALGGGCYTVGILFYAIRKIPFNHFIWHCFVLAGAAFHWVMIWSLLN